MILLSILFFQIDSLTLNQTIEIALEKSPLYLESKETLAKSKIQFYQALSQLLPTKSATGSWTHTEFNTLKTANYNGTLNLSLPVLDFDIIGSILLSKREYKGGTLQHNQEMANLILELKKSYYNLITANELQNSTQKALKRAIENKKLIEEKYKLGAASRFDLLQSEVYYLEVLQKESRAKSLLVQAQEELKAILNLKDDIYPLDSLTMPDSFVLPTLDSLKELLRKANLSIKLAEEYKNIARANLIISCLAFLPRVSFFYRYNFNLDTFKFDFEYIQDNMQKNYGVTVTFPIFELKTLVFNQFLARKDLRIKGYQKMRTILESEKALTTTYYSLKETITSLEFARKGLETAEEAGLLTREQYALGLISLLDFFRTEEEYYNARVNLTQALNDYHIQRATLSYLLGGIIIEE